MRKRTLAVAVLAGTLTVGAFAHGAMNDQDNMQNQGAAQGMMGQGTMNQGTMNQGMMNQGMQKQTMYKQGFKNRRMGMGMMGRQGMGMMGRQGMMGQGMGMMGQMNAFSKLNLNSDQRFKISILRDEMRIDMKKLMHNLRQNSNMGSFIKNDTFDKDAFENKMNNMHKKMLDLKANHMEKIFKVLTKQQIEQLKNSMAK